MKKITNYTKIIAVFFVFALFSKLCVTAQETPIHNVYHTILDNGLEVFVLENESASNTYIELALRGGTRIQSSKTAGLLNVCNQMILKKNNVYKTSDDFQEKLTQIGANKIKSSIENDCTKFYFSVPSNFTQPGLEFLSAIIRHSLFDPTDLENEKKIIIPKISAAYEDANNMFAMSVAQALFPKHPWSLDSFGSINNIQEATVEQLQTIYKTYYTPNNAAIFVGGNVHHEDIYKLVENSYGDWENADNSTSSISEAKLHATEKTQFLVMPHAQISPEIAQVTVLYRGPGTLNDSKNTYVADAFTALSENSLGPVKQTLIKKPELSIPAPEFIHCNYYTQQESGSISFTALMRAPEKTIAQQAQVFQNTIQTQIVDGIITNDNYFTIKEYANLKQELQKKDLFQVNSVSDFLDRICFWWASSSTDYFFNYYKNVKTVTATDISNFTKKYLKDKSAVVTVLVNPDVYELQQEQFLDAGFTTITKENAYWWNQHILKNAK